jgi:hypothetical protein
MSHSMNAVDRIRSRTMSAVTKVAYALSKRPHREYLQRLSIAEIGERFGSANEQWAYFHHFFWHLAPDWLREHRAFFAAGKRGFGEDAIHAMWYILLSEVRPSRFLEIGVYRGQIISLVKLIAARMGFECRVLGISPFTAVGDDVSSYGDFDYETEVREFCARFGTPLRDNELLRALSTDAAAAEAIRRETWDIGYIDGNHSYEVAASDFALVSSSVTPDNGLIVLDDAALYTGYRPKVFSFAGHPGPSKLLKECLARGWSVQTQAGHNVVISARQSSRL